MAKEREKNEKDRRDKRLETRHGGSARKDNRDNDGLSAAAVAGAAAAASMYLKKAAKKSDLTGTETGTPSQVGSPSRATRRGTESPGTPTTPSPAGRGRKRISSAESSAGDSDSGHAPSEDEAEVTGAQMSELAKEKLKKRARIKVEHLDDLDSLVFLI